MSEIILAKYNQSKTIHFELFEVDGVDLRVDAVFEAASSDVQLMLNEGADADSSNGFTDEGKGYSLVLTATEMSNARITIYIVDQTATKVWLDRAIHIETYGHASAEHAFDLDTAMQDVNVIQINETAVIGVGTSGDKWRA